APWRIDHPDIEPEIAFVVSASEDGRRSASSVHFRGRLVCTTHSVDAALDVVERLLHAYAPAPAGTMWMRARALERAGGVLLVSDTFREALDGHHRRVARAGFADLGVSPVRVDPRAAEVLWPVGEPGATRWRRVPIAAAVVFAPDDVDVSP